MLSANIQFFKEEDVEKFYDSSLDLLKKVGLKLDDLEILIKEI